MPSSATAELRELAHGILPAVLTQRRAARGSGRAGIADAGAGRDQRVRRPAPRSGRGDRLLRRLRGADQRRQTRSRRTRRGDRADRGRHARGPGSRRRRSAAPGRTGAVSWGSRTVSPPSTASSGSRAQPTAARSSRPRSPSPARSGLVELRQAKTTTETRCCFRLGGALALARRRHCSFPCKAGAAGESKVRMTTTDLRGMSASLREQMNPPRQTTRSKRASAL